MTQAERTGPLEDLTIIDCTRALAGPYGAGLLADLGAKVITAGLCLARSLHKTV